MKSTNFFVIAVLVFATLLSACGSATVTASQPAVRTINVNGTGSVNMTPDIAYIYLGVHTEDASASQAVSTNNIQTQKVIDALKKLNVAEKDIRTTNFSIYPSQNFDPSGKPLDTKYMVDNTVYVTIRDLTKLGNLLDSVLSAGVNTVNSIQFYVADNTAALKQARDQAVKSAQTQAQELADVAGVKLGEVQTISFFDSIPTPMLDSGKGGGGGMAAAASVPIQPGQLTLTATVSMTYSIK